MSEYIESVVGDEGKILIEVTNGRGSVGFGHLKDHPDKKTEMTDAFNHALNTIRLTAGGVLETLNTLTERPDVARVDFAIKFDPEAGPMIAAADSKSQLRVSLTWNNKPEEGDDDD